MVTAYSKEESFVLVCSKEEIEAMALALRDAQISDNEQNIYSIRVRSILNELVSEINGLVN